MKLLFFPGGPGLNPRGEEVLLSDALRTAGLDAHFWYEPSRLRPNGPRYREEDAWGNYLAEAESCFLTNSAREPVVLAGHSFGCNAVHALVRRHQDRVVKLVFIAPDLVIEQTDRHMMQIAQQDFARAGDDRARVLSRIIDRYSGSWDENTEEGFRLVGQDPHLFNNYWYDKQRMAEYFACLDAPEYQLDVDAFFAVRRSYMPPTQWTSEVPAVAIFGEHDVVISRDAEVRWLQRCYPNIDVRVVPNTAHYPHVEATDTFVRLIS